MKELEDYFWDQIKSNTRNIHIFAESTQNSYSKSTPNHLIEKLIGNSNELSKETFEKSKLKINAR